MSKYTKISIWYLFVIGVALYLAYLEGASTEGLVVGGLLGSTAVLLYFCVQVYLNRGRSKNG